MNIIKDTWHELIKIPNDIKKHLTPVGLCTVWIPLSSAVIVLVLLFCIMIVIINLLNKLTCNIIPNLIIKRSIIKDNTVYTPHVWPEHCMNKDDTYNIDVQHDFMDPGDQLSIPIYKKHEKK